jgi:hypothetical protein
LQDKIVGNLLAATLALEVPRQLDKVDPGLWEVRLSGADHLPESVWNSLTGVGNVRGKQSKTESLLDHFMKRGRDDIFYQKTVPLAKKIVKVPVQGLAEFDQLLLQALTRRHQGNQDGQ